MHDLGILHNDLHDGNILLQQDRQRKVWVAKIIDFGSSSIVGRDDDEDDDEENVAIGKEEQENGREEAMENENDKEKEREEEIAIGLHTSREAAWPRRMVLGETEKEESGGENRKRERGRREKSEGGEEDISQIRGLHPL